MRASKAQLARTAMASAKDTKDDEAFRTISEAASELDLPQHVLRFWETRFGQIRPVKRGGGRRYYRRQDIDLLRAIKELLYDRGYTIKGVQKILKEKGVAEVVAAPGDEVHRAPADEPESPTHADPADITPKTELRSALNEVLGDLRVCLAALEDPLEHTLKGR